MSDDRLVERGKQAVEALIGMPVGNRSPMFLINRKEAMTLLESYRRDVEAIAQSERASMEGEIVEELRRALDHPEEAVNRLNSNFLGEKVRIAWVKWAETQPNPKPSWLVPFRDLSEPDKQADREIGIALARLGAGAFAAQNRFLFKRIIDALASSKTGDE